MEAETGNGSTAKKSKPRPYFGSENAILKYMDNAGKWQRVPADGKYPGTNVDIPKNHKYVDSILMAWIRQGNSLSGERQAQLANASDNVFLQAVQVHSNQQSEDLAQKSAQQTVVYASRIECFFMKAMANSGFAKSLVRILERLGVRGAEDVDIPAITALEYDAFVTYLRLDTTTEIGMEGLYVSFVLISVYGTLLLMLD